MDAESKDEEEEDDWFAAPGANLWLLPIMREHLCGAHLAFFTGHFLPLAKHMASTSAQASQQGNALLAQRAATAEYQVRVR